MANPSMVIRVAASVAELRANLAEGKSQIETTTASMEKMAQSLSGEKLTQSAQNITAAVAQIGGASMLTVAEQARVNATVERAIEKYRVMGQEAPAAMVALANATAGAAAPTNSLHGSLTQVDGVLASMGINMSKEIRAIGELGEASGKSASDIGLIGSAGLAVGAAMGGWKIGRAIADFFDLDDAIANATARLMGYGDVAAETAGAKQDTINRAIAQGADAAISYTEAIKFNAEAIKTVAVSYVDWETKLKNAQKEVDALTGEELEQIEIAKRMGATQADLKHDFGLSEDAIRLLNDTIREYHDETDAAAEADAKAKAAIEGKTSAVVAAVPKEKTLLEVLDEILGIQGPLQEGFRFTSTTVGELGDKAEEAKKKLEALQTKLKITAEETRSFQSSATNLAGGTHSIQPLTQSQLSALAPPAAGTGRIDEGKIWAKLAQLERLEGTYAPKTGEEYMRMINDQVLLSQLRMWAQGKDRPPGLKDGTDSWRGGPAIVGERGPELVDLPRGARVTPNHELGGTTIMLAPVLNFNAPIVGSSGEFREMVSAALLDVFRTSGLPLPALR